MTIGSLGGCTDYTHQSFQDILIDLKKEKDNTISFKKSIMKNIQNLKEKSYWDNNVSFDFQNIVLYALEFYKTTIVEIEDIYNEIQKEVKEHHIKRLQEIASVLIK